jgi:hypothetical protein
LPTVVLVTVGLEWGCRMRRHLLVAAAVIAVAACNTTPLPTAAPSPTATPVVSPTQTPTTATTPSPTTATPPNPPPTASVITEQVGLLTVTHPVAWRLVAGPKDIPGRPVPLFYLSNAPLTVGPCPTPDPKSGEFQGCPEPLAALPSGGVLVTVNPNLGLPAMNPPQVTFENKTKACQAIGGEAEMWSVVGGTVLTACLRGPDLAAQEAEVRAVIASLKPTA